MITTITDNIIDVQTYYIDIKKDTLGPIDIPDLESAYKQTKHLLYQIENLPSKGLYKTNAKKLLNTMLDYFSWITETIQVYNNLI